MKVKIIRLGKRDAHYNDRKELIGLAGECEVIGEYENGWKGISFIPDNNPWPEISPIHFFNVKIEILESE